MRTWAVLLILLGLASGLGWRAYRRLNQKDIGSHQGRLFYELARGGSARFAVRGGSAVNLVSYFAFADTAQAPENYRLQIAFLSDDGTQREYRTVTLSVDSSSPGPMLSDGMRLARARLVRLAPPANTAVIEVGSPDGRSLLRAARLTERRVAREGVLRRSGVDPLWIAADEAQGVLAQRWVTMPALLEIPSVNLLPAPASAPGTEPERTVEKEQLAVGPHQALVFNLLGPGTVTIQTSNPGHLQLQLIGAAGATAQTMPGSSIDLAIPEGPASLILQSPDGSQSTVQLKMQKVRALRPEEPAQVPARHRGSAWRVASGLTIPFPMYGRDAAPSPVRLSVRGPGAAGAKPLRWRFADEKGQTLLQGSVPLRAGYDAFAAIEQGGKLADIGLSSSTILQPPSGAVVLEVAAEQALLQLDALLGIEAHPQPAPPFDVPLAPGLHFVDVPARAPRWLPLRPRLPVRQRQPLHAALVRMPRIERRPVVPAGSFVSVQPRNAQGVDQIAEPTRHPGLAAAARISLPAEREVAVVVAQQGGNARRLAVTCEVPGRLGGQLVLLLDGHEAAKAPVSTATVRLEASSPAGVHRVRVTGSASARCDLLGRAAGGAATAPRRVYLLPARTGLQVPVATHGVGAQPLHFALYVEPGAVKEGVLKIQVDAGVPVRRAGPLTVVTQSEVNQHFQEETARAPVKLQRAARVVRRVAVTKVLLGDDLPAGGHIVTLSAQPAGRYWVRFWTPGQKIQRERLESFISTEQGGNEE